ncbi:hypothetical protein [Megamonas hypermegale]|uniref:hypothetical protein n=1 Tax=Megamonas hypermegale TaxID=158847 RepID=UPI002431BD64|nr:hypothetical protein [Megamonas hypermegale]
MRNIVSFIFVFILIIVPSSCFAFQNEPNGFRNLYWGETLQEVQKDYATTYLYYSAMENSVIYTIPLIDKNIGGVYSKDNVIYLGFWNNQLYSIFINFPEDTLEASTQTYKDLIYSMSLYYNTPTVNDSYSSEYNSNSTMWIGNTSSILLNQSLTSNKYSYKYDTTIIIRNNYLAIKAIKDGTSRGW